jgi:hypothetical protein
MLPPAAPGTAAAPGAGAAPTAVDTVPAGVVLVMSVAAGALPANVDDAAILAIVNAVEGDVLERPLGAAAGYPAWSFAAVSIPAAAALAGKVFPVRGAARVSFQPLPAPQQPPAQAAAPKLQPAPAVAALPAIAPAAAAVSAPPAPAQLARAAPPPLPSPGFAPNASLPAAAPAPAAAVAQAAPPQVGGSGGAAAGGAFPLPAAPTSGAAATAAPALAAATTGGAGTAAGRLLDPAQAPIAASGLSLDDVLCLGERKALDIRRPALAGGKPRVTEVSWSALPGRMTRLHEAALALLAQMSAAEAAGVAPEALAAQLALDMQAKGVRVFTLAGAASVLSEDYAAWDERDDSGLLGEAEFAARAGLATDDLRYLVGQGHLGDAVLPGGAPDGGPLFMATEAMAAVAAALRPLDGPEVRGMLDAWGQLSVADLVANAAALPADSPLRLVRWAGGALFCVPAALQMVLQADA